MYSFAEAVTTELDLAGYDKLHTAIELMPPDEQHSIRRTLCRNDLYYLLRHVLHRSDVAHPWLLARCRDVQLSPNENLDLWSREHYKSTIITFALTIQDILSSHGEDPLAKWNGIEPTFGIFSHTRPIAKKFLRQIKREFEDNADLRSLFPDIIWDRPDQEAPVWSLDDGIILRRKSNPKEATVEAWGLVDSQPTAAHFFIRIYDDVVTRKSVYTPGSIKLTTESWELSLNLAQRGGHSRYIGTRYHLNDTYSTLMKRKVANVRLFPATADGKPEGPAVFLTDEELARKRREMGSFTFASQMLQNPTADSVQGFDQKDMRFYTTMNREGLNVYIIVDPANEKKRDSDYTALMVIGLGADHNYYLLDAVRDRLGLAERGQLVIDKHREWEPQGVGYEKYGKDADIEYIEELQDRQNYRFEIIPLAGSLGNFDRVRRLIPGHQDHRWFYPKTMSYVDYENKSVDLIQVLTDEELIPFPVGVHVDMMDAQSRIHDEDMKIVWPKSSAYLSNKVVPINRGYTRRRGPANVPNSTAWIV